MFDLIYSVYKSLLIYVVCVLGSMNLLVMEYSFSGTNTEAQVEVTKLFKKISVAMI